MTQTSSGNGATPESGQPATGTPPGTDETSGTKLPQSIEDALKQVESLQAALKAANKESAGHRIKAKELDELKAKIEADKLSETEKLQKQVNDLQSQYDEAVRQLEEDRNYATLERTGRTLGITDATALDDAVNLALIKLATEEDESAKPEDVMKDIIKSRPWLTNRQAQAAAGGATNPSRTQSSGVTSADAFIADLAAGRVTNEDYNKLSGAMKAAVTAKLINRQY